MRHEIDLEVAVPDQDKLTDPRGVLTIRDTEAIVNHAAYSAMR